MIWALVTFVIGFAMGAAMVLVARPPRHHDTAKVAKLKAQLEACEQRVAYWRSFSNEAVDHAASVLTNWEDEKQKQRHNNTDNEDGA